MILKTFLGGQGLNPHLPFFGGKIWNYQLNASISMVREIANGAWEVKRKFERINYPEEVAQSGDPILITRFDGVD